MVFATAGVAPRQRLELWRETYEPFNRMVPQAIAPEDFEARNEIWSLGELAVTSNAAPAMAFERTARHIRRDSIDHIVIRVGRAGEARYRFGDTAFAAAPAQPVLFSLGAACQSERTAADWVSLYIPRDAHPALAAGLETLGNRALTGPGAALLAESLVALHRRLPEMPRAQGPALAEAMRAMVTACLLSDVAPRLVRPADAAVALRARVRQVIRDHIASAALTPARICRLAGVSRSHLYRLFEAEGGVARYVQSLRLRLALDALTRTEPQRPILAVAESLGFYDASAFSRAFRREFGVTPSEARAATAAGGLVPIPLPRGRPVEAPALGFSDVIRRIGVTQGSPLPRAA